MAANYRRYPIRGSATNNLLTPLIHFYRSEVEHANFWRQRLDRTTNWAVFIAGIAITLALSEPSHHYGVIPLGTLLVTLLLVIEARHYRFYHVAAARVRLLETDFFAAILSPSFFPTREWAGRIAQNG